MKLSHSSLEHSIELENALLAWIKLLGSDRVLCRADQLEVYWQDTVPHPPKASAVLKPLSTQEVQELVQIANQFKVPIYPISKGKNWGYGSACPVQEGNVIIDLSGMNKILEVNIEQAYCIVEPGVTQQDLYEYLTRHHIPLVMDVTGAP